MKRAILSATLRRSVVPRRAAAMVFVLILLLVISMMGASLVRGAIAQHRQRLRDELHVQTVRLAEAGWNRALLQLAQTPDYPGEVWRLDESQLGADRTAEVRIELRRDEADPPRVTLQVVAEYPLGQPLVNRVTHSGIITAN